MSDTILGLSPPLLWELFHRLASVPRPSQKEDRAVEFVMRTATALGLEARKDTAGNIIVRKPASMGHEGAPPVALQGHLDMVCEARHGVTHDFAADGIRLVRADGFLMADGTTLGADNGIGVAAALAVMKDRTLTHGPLEFLFTVNEETGLNGVSLLDPAFLRSRILLNLDSEQEGAIFIGCAGSRTAVLRSQARRESVPRGFVPLTVGLSGLQGGHSGVDIDKVRGNAIRLLARALIALSASNDLRIGRLTGGSKRNAIPREAEAVVFVRGERLKAFRDALDDISAVIWSEWGPFAEPHLTIGISPEKPITDGSVFVKEDQQNIVSLLYALPTGIIAMSAAVPGVVETSLNLAVLRTNADSVTTEVYMRSFLESALDDLGSRVAVTGRLAGSAVELIPGYPSWRPDPSSKLLKTVVDTFASLFGGPPAIRAIHAGLECAVIGKKVEGMTMVSFGPTIEGAHSPDERVEIASVERFWRLLTAVLARLA